MKKSNLHVFSRVLFTLALSLTMSFAYAQDENVSTFVGGGGNALWSNANNWENGSKPENGDVYTLVYILSDVIVDEDVAIDYLKDNIGCNLTVKEGKRLSVNDSIVWNQGGDFVLSDGAQLVYPHNLDVVVEKRIAAFNEDHHALDFIASPLINSVTPSTENGIATEAETGFDLSYYDETSSQWIYYRDTPFDLEHGHGYAYANAYDTVLLFEGTVMGSLAPVETSLDYHQSNGGFAGCNFVGNPLPCNVFVSRSYYALDEKGTSMLAVPASASVAIAPCESIFVKAENTGEVVAFSKTNDWQPSENQCYLSFSISKSNDQNASVDKAILSFNPGDDLGKFIIMEMQPALYFTKDSKSMAILSSDDSEPAALKFKPAESTSYTLKTELIGLDLNYLHLIDNITGSNIDLLQNPEYTFNATVSDYVSRFKLVFNSDNIVEESHSAHFAYYADGQIRISYETADATSLQVIDMNGRIVQSEAINGRDGVHTVSTNLIPGIYVLRLASGNAVMTQKMAIY